MFLIENGPMCTRSFGQPLTERDVIGEALAAFVSRVAEKLRAEALVAETMTVLLHTSRYGADVGSGQPGAVTLPTATMTRRRYWRWRGAG